MKLHLTIALILSVIANLANAQTWNIQWEHTTGIQQQDYFADTDQTPDGGCVVLGSVSTGNSSDFWLIRYNAQGDTTWTKQLKNPETGVPGKVRYMKNEDLIILGKLGDETTTNTVLIRTDSKGNEKWRQTLDVTKNELGNDIVPLTDNGFLVSGSSGVSGNNMWLVRFDENGQKLWEKNYQPGIAGTINAAKQLPNGGFVLSARVQGSAKNDCDIMVLRTDSNGNEIWFKQLKSPQIQEWPECICCSPDSSFILVGWAGNCLNDINSDYPVFDHNLLVKKLDKNGTVIWSRSIDSEGSEGGNAVVVRPDGHFIVAGAKLTSFSGKIGPWLLHLDTDGNTLDETLLNMRYNQASKIINTSDGGFIVIGPGFHDKLNMRSDGWIVKFAEL